jgi:glycosyltransferase involved in cell wall biosynthesis
MCEALMKRGVEVQIASTDGEPAGTDAESNGRQSLQLNRLTDYQGVPAIFFKRDASEAFKYSRGLSHWLHRNVSAFDVVHIHGVFSHACTAAADACRRAGVPYIIRPLGNLEGRSLALKPLKKRLFLRLFGNKMLANASAVHYVCFSEKEQSEAALGLNHGVVVPLGINLTAIKPTKTTNRKPHILVLSRLEPSKGIDVLIEAFLNARQVAGLSEWQLFIGGKGSPDCEAALKRTIETRKATDSVHLMGWLDGEAKSEALQQASLLALPSRRDAFGYCLIEGISQGIPVITTPQVGLAKEISDAGAGWITSLEFKALSETLSAAMSDENERCKRGEAGRELAARFDWAELALTLVKLYKSILPTAVRT